MRPSTLSATAIVLLPLGAVTLAAPSNLTLELPAGLWPHVADTSHASQALVNFLDGYFTAKNLHEPDSWMAYFHPTEGLYGDVGLGNIFSQPDLGPVVKTLMEMWAPSSRSYPLRVIGDTESALMYMVDTPDMFGDELRILVALDFKDGVIVREVDYWDPRRNLAAIANRVLPDEYPRDFAPSISPNSPNVALQDVVRRFSSALALGDHKLASTLLAPDVVFEDLSLRARLDGRRATERYLMRALKLLPYGIGSTVNHVVGSSQGGAYEWNGHVNAAGHNGITALELGEDGLITWLASVWDTFNTSNETMEDLAKLSIEP